MLSTLHKELKVVQKYINKQKFKDDSNDFSEAFNPKQEEKIQLTNIYLL